MGLVRDRELERGTWRCVSRPDADVIPFKSLAALTAAIDSARRYKLSPEISRQIGRQQQPWNMRGR